MSSKFLLILFLASLSAFSQEADILIKNGRLIDGTGNPWRYSDIAIKDGKIVGLGLLRNVSAKKVIDAKGMIVAPGFIDVHTHIESDEVRNPTADNFIYDGVTTVITGNCGASRLKINEYLAMIDSLKPSINVATLIGHNEVRRTVMGSANRDPSEDELVQMETLVEQAMLDGAVGLSTGLIYIPGTYSKTPEIIRLAKVAAKYDGLYASHMRGEGDSVVPAIYEALTIGKEASLPVQISHFKVSGQHNWGRSTETVALVSQARNEGIEVTIDQYPYTASSTSLSTMFPEEILADGQDSISARLLRPEVKKYVINDMLKSLKKRKLKHFSYPVVANYRFDTTLNGKSIEEVNRIKGKKHKAKYEAE